MAITVDEIMNHELFSLRPGDGASDALEYLLALSIGGAPVLDGDGRVVGVVSLRDLVDARERVEDRMTKPVVTVAAGSTIEAAARLLAETGLHRLPVVDRDRRAVGMVSSVDIVRGLLGMPARHPPLFPHYDATHGVSWTNDTELAPERIEAAPDGAGVLVLVHGGAGAPERVVWAEATEQLRSRLLDLLSLPQGHLPSLERWLRRGSLRFRAAAVADPAHRRSAAAAILEEARRAGLPTFVH
jgi:hypothetical protein